MLGVGVRVFHNVDATHGHRIQVHDLALAIVRVASTGLGVPNTNYRGNQLRQHDQARSGAKR